MTARKSLPNPAFIMGQDDHPKAIRAADVYARFRKGATVEEIAAADGMAVEKVQQSLDHAMMRHEVDIKQRLRIERLEAQRANERLRKKARKKMGEKFLDAIDKLLDGKKVVFSRDTATGAILTETIDDMESLVAGIEAFRKTTSLEEKPMPTPTVALHVEQNNATGANGTVRFGGLEESLARIRDRHRSQPHDADPDDDDEPIDVPASEVVPDAEVIPEPKAPDRVEGEWGF